MNLTERRERFRAVLAGSRCVHPASVYDPISVRIAEELGFEICMLAGSIASYAVLGAPDIVVLTLTEFAQLVLRISRASSLPLLVDADHGYGNALNVKRTVEELETAGVAALSIEDTLLPTAYGQVGQTSLISLEEGLGKMRAAVAGRQDPALVIAARTSAMAVAGLEEALRRARAYAETGVDALFMIGINTREELDAIAGAVKLPLILGNAPAAIGDRDYLASRNVRVALQGHTPFMAAIRAVYETMKALREGASPRDMRVAPDDLVKRVTRDRDYKSWMNDLLGGDQRKAG
jgi:carboxyvinyl-carboxyphosphonate phosphorylmutase